MRWNLIEIYYYNTVTEDATADEYFIISVSIYYVMDNVDILNVHFLYITQFKINSLFLRNSLPFCKIMFYKQLIISDNNVRLYKNSLWDTVENITSFNLAISIKSILNYILRFKILLKKWIFWEKYTWICYF